MVYEKVSTIALFMGNCANSIAIHCITLGTGGWKVAFDYLKVYPQTPSAANLRAAALTELVALYSTTFISDWVHCVANYNSSYYGSPCN